MVRDSPRWLVRQTLLPGLPRGLQTLTQASREVLGESEWTVWRARAFARALGSEESRGIVVGRKVVAAVVLGVAWRRQGEAAAVVEAWCMQALAACVVVVYGEEVRRECGW